MAKCAGSLLAATPASTEPRPGGWHCSCSSSLLSAVKWAVTVHEANPLPSSAFCPAAMPSRTTFSPNEDPLDVVLRPPPEETPTARAERLRREAEAKKISDAIDESIRQEKLAWKKNKSLLRLLLLGQSESGECPSTTHSAPLWSSPHRRHLPCTSLLPCNVVRCQSPVDRIMCSLE